MRALIVGAPRTIAAVAVLVGLIGSAHALSIDVGSATGAPGSTVTFRVTLSTTGQNVVGTISRVSWDPHTPIASNPDGSPDCRLSNLFQDTFRPSFSPTDCTPTVNCTAVSAVNLQFSTNPIVIRDGTLLYSCNVNIPFDAPQGSFPLTCSNPEAANVKGVAFDGTARVCSGDGLTGCHNDNACVDRLCAGDQVTVCGADTDCALVGGPCGTAVGGQCTVVLPAVTCTDGQIVVSGSPLPTPSATTTPSVTTTPSATSTPEPGGGGGGCQVMPIAAHRWLALGLVCVALIALARARLARH